MKIGILREVLKSAKFFIVSVLCITLSGCSQTGQPVPTPTKTIYVPAPSQNGGSIGTFNQNELQQELDAAKQSACDSAQEIQWQWVQLNNQIYQLESTRFSGTPGDFNLDLDSQIAQLRNQVFQLQQQEQSLRQLCSS